MHLEQLPDGPCSPNENSVSRKCQRQLPVTVVAGITNKRLLHIQDRALGHSFFINTCEDLSLIPAAPANHCAAIFSTQSTPLVAANGTVIKTYGTRCHSLR